MRTIILVLLMSSIGFGQSNLDLAFEVGTEKSATCLREAVLWGLELTNQTGHIVMLDISGPFTTTGRNTKFDLKLINETGDTLRQRDDGMSFGGRQIFKRLEHGESHVFMQFMNPWFTGLSVGNYKLIIEASLILKTGIDGLTKRLSIKRETNLRIINCGDEYLQSQLKTAEEKIWQIDTTRLHSGDVESEVLLREVMRVVRIEDTSKFEVLVKLVDHPFPDVKALATEELIRHQYENARKAIMDMYRSLVSRCIGFEAWRTEQSNWPYHKYSAQCEYLKKRLEPTLRKANWIE